MDLYTLIQYDGHPMLWYLLLHAGTSIADTPLVLPVTSIALAFAAVALFLTAAPFPFWLRALFIFSALPLYEYSVMARNYGISMLLLFLTAVLWRDRVEHPIRLAVVLALLANTNVHSAMLAGIIAAVWARDLVAGRRERAAGRSVLMPFAIVAVGILLSAAVAMPRENTVLTSVHRSVAAVDVWAAAWRAATRPHETFVDLTPEAFPRLATAVLLGLAVLGLAGRPSPAASAAAGKHPN